MSPSSPADIAQQHWQRYLVALQLLGVDCGLDVARTTALQELFAASDYAAWVAMRYPVAVQDLLLSGAMERAYAETDWLALAQAELAHEATDEAGLMRALRRYRHLQLLRIAYRDIHQLAAIEVILAELSALAESCIELALATLSERAFAVRGRPRDGEGREQGLIVLGLGKLGGGELNFSSDVDLIFAFGAHGETDAEVPEASIQFFTRLAQQLIRVLSEPTEDGFAYRVDTRLRPFGDSGPLVTSQAALENYLLTQGREWERYAMIKARVVAGDRLAGAQTLAAVRPFVYRRYLDYGAFDALREMKRKIARQVSQRGLRDDIKLGDGGIREIEFIAQAFQIIRGGREPELQQTRLLPVLRLLGERGVLAATTSEQLQQAYGFLRRLENRLQMLADEQRHAVPQDALRQARLAKAMGYADWPALLAALRWQRALVSEHFANVFQSQEAATPTATHVEQEQLRALWADDWAVDEAVSSLQQLGYSDAAGLQARLQGLRHGVWHAQLSSTARLRLKQLMPSVFAICARSVAPDVALIRMLELVQAIAGRSVYFSLLNENPHALQRLVSLFALSPWLAAYLAQQPLLLDELLDSRNLSDWGGLAESKAAAQQALHTVAAGDIETAMDALRHFKHRQVFHVVAADLEGRLPLMKVSDQLTWTAEAVLQQAYQLVWQAMLDKHGRPCCQRDGQSYYPGISIIAYGKLAGLELGYSSDLDIVFLHDSSGETQQTDGAHSLENHVFFTRFAQRLITCLSSRTGAGVLYEIDTRLRPNGQAGLLVSSLQAYQRYQHESAWTWEHQALVRARAVIGPESLCAAFEAVRREVLSKPRALDKLRQDILDMRAKMNRELVNDSWESAYKHASGGMTDIEFMVQYAVLAAAAEHPELLRWTDNIRQLEDLQQAGVIVPAMAEELIDAYKILREALHRASLCGQALPMDDPACVAQRHKVSRWWQAWMLAQQ